MKRVKKSIFYPRSSLFMISKKLFFIPLHSWFKCLHKNFPLCLLPFYFIFLHHSLSLFLYVSVWGTKNKNKNAFKWQSEREQKRRVFKSNAILVMMTGGKRMEHLLSHILILSKFHWKKVDFKWRERLWTESCRELKNRRMLTGSGEKKRKIHDYSLSLHLFWSSKRERNLY